MTSDHFLRLCDADYHELQRAYRALGFTGESHDAVVLRQSQFWRLIDGAEPNSLLSTGVLATHMRYAPYMAAP